MSGAFISTVQLRWALRGGTNTDGPRLQYREVGRLDGRNIRTPWENVPRVVVDDETYENGESP